MNHNLKLSNEGDFKIENNIRNYRHFSNSFMKGKLKLTREVQLIVYINSFVTLSKRFILSKK